MTYSNIGMFKHQHYSYRQVQTLAAELLTGIAKEYGRLKAPFIFLNLKDKHKRTDAKSKTLFGLKKVFKI